MSSSVSRITRKAADKVTKGLKNRVTLDLDCTGRANAPPAAGPKRHPWPGERATLGR